MWCGAAVDGQNTTGCSELLLKRIKQACHNMYFPALVPAQLVCPKGQCYAARYWYILIHLGIIYVPPYLGIICVHDYLAHTGTNHYSG